jgi:uncharacterized protein (DUF885 family)
MRACGGLRRGIRLDPSRLPPGDRITRNALLFEIESERATIACGFETWVVDPLDGPQVDFFNVPSYQPLTDPASGDAMVARWRAMGPTIDQHVANLRRGLGQGKVSIRSAVERVIAEIDDIESTDRRLALKPARSIPEAAGAARPRSSGTAKVVGKKSVPLLRCGIS